MKNLKRGRLFCSPLISSGIHRFFWLTLVLPQILFFASCEKDPATTEDKHQKPHSTPYNFELPAHFPEPELPEDNPMTMEKIRLGKKLFFDPILSRDSSVSCGSCHFQHLAFTDGKVKSIGIEGRISERNATTLANLAYHDRFFMDKGVATLELQVIAPIEDEAEMDFNIPDLLERLQKHPDYVAEFSAVFDREPDLFGLTRAIAAFERSLISANSPYDRYLMGEETALSSEQKRGKALFFSEYLMCSSCHSGFLLTNLNLENNGLYEDYEDYGHQRVTGQGKDNALFKVPTLRNIELTAPYMHDGSMESLEEVIEHYASGGKPHFNKSDKIKGFEISEAEKKALIAFLKSFTDEQFISNKAFQPEN